MFSRIHDRFGRSLLILFLIKPTIDLFFWVQLPFGLRLLPVFAALVFVYFLQFRFQRTRTTPPFLRLIETFLALHVIALVIGSSTNERLTVILAVDWSLRILDSYLIYYTTFLAATRSQYRDVTPFVTAIVIGSTIPVIANVIAVPTGFKFGVFQAGISAAEMAFRERGLYYDPGVLANMAFFHLIFTVFLLHLSPLRKRVLFTGSLLLLVIADFYLISVTKSRAVTVELALFGFIYLLMFQRRWGKILAPIVTVTVLGIAVALFDIDLTDMLVRFESDAAALEGNAEFDVRSGDVSFGSLEGLGNNRGMLWANSLAQLLRRPIAEFLFGNFSPSKSHSDYIDILSRSGLVSLLVYLAIMGGLTWRSLRMTRTARNSHDRTVFFMAFILLVCYLFYAMSFRPLAYTTTSWYMWTVIGLAMARAWLAPMEAAAMRQRAALQPQNGAPPDEPVPGDDGKDDDPTDDDGIPTRARPSRPG